MGFINASPSALPTKSRFHITFTVWMRVETLFYVTRYLSFSFWLYNLSMADTLDASNHKEDALFPQEVILGFCGIVCRSIMYCFESMTLKDGWAADGSVQRRLLIWPRWHSHPMHCRRPTLH